MVEQGNFFLIITFSKRTVMLKYNGFLICILVIVSTVFGVGARQTSEKKIAIEQEASIEKHSSLSLHIRSARASDEGTVKNSEDKANVTEGNQVQEKSEENSSREGLKTSSAPAITANESKAEQNNVNASEVKKNNSTEKTVESEDGAGTKNGESTLTKTTAPMESPMHDGAFLRGFYVFVGIGVIVIVFFAVKGLRLRQNRAARRYKVLPYRDDQEMFPLAADDDEDEEIFNAVPRN